MAEPTGTRKAAERRGVATALGAERVVMSDWLSVQVRHRDRLPAWLRDALADARQAAEPGQLAVAVFHEHRSRDRGESVVCLRLADFSLWFAPEVGGG